MDDSHRSGNSNGQQAYLPNNVNQGSSSGVTGGVSGSNTYLEPTPKGRDNGRIEQDGSYVTG